MALVRCRMVELPQGLFNINPCRTPLKKISSNSGDQITLVNRINAIDSFLSVNVGITVSHNTPHITTPMINAVVNRRSPIKSGHRPRPKSFSTSLMKLDKELLCIRKKDAPDKGGIVLNANER